MMEEKLRIFSRIGLLLDIVFTVGAFWIAYLLRAYVIPMPPDALPLEFSSLAWLLFIIVPVWIILLPYQGTYITLEKRVKETYFPLFKAIFLGSLLLFAAIIMLRVVGLSRLFLLLFAVINYLLLLGLRVWVFPLFAGRDTRRVFIVGDGKDGDDLREFLLSSPIRLQLKKFSGDIKEFESIASDWVDWVVIAAPPEEFLHYENIVGFCREMGIPVSFAIKGSHRFGKMGFKVEEYSGLSLFTISTASQLSLLLTGKYITDRVVALILFLLLSPLFLVIAVLIKMESEGPLIFMQPRCGLNGKLFNILKFRTMWKDAEENRHNFHHLNVMDRVVFKVKNDPRITRMGKILRRFSLDELPQIINCIRGEMSIVGPRPPIPEEVRKYKPYERRRLSMRPGLTCLWQVSGRNEIDFDRWMELDLEYIDNWTPFVDIKLLFLTIPAVISGRGAY